MDQKIIPNNQQQKSQISNNNSRQQQNSKSSIDLSQSSSEINQNKQIDKQDQINKDIKRQQFTQRKRYKYCCKICKHTDKNKKACVCVVPLGQRRTQLAQTGCQTCGCAGCSKEDYISRGEDPQYKPGEKKKQKQLDFQARNGCCRKCMKAFSKTNKACLCQVPQVVRKGKLPPTGCKICNCFGCNPQDKKQQKDRRVLKSKSRSRSRQRKHRTHKKSHRKSQSILDHQIIDPIAMNFYNIDRSLIGSMIKNDYQLTPILFGFGVPQRSQSYIIGKPK